MTDAGFTLDGSPSSGDDDVAAGFAAITLGAGLHDLSHWQWLQITGADHIDFIHRMCTNAVADCDTGDAIEIVFTDARGRIVERADLYRLDDDRSWLVLGPGSPNTLATWLDRYIFSEAIEFCPPATTDRMIEIIGPAARSCVSQVLPQLTQTGACGRIAPDLVFAHHQWTGLDVFRLAGSAPVIGDLWRRLAAGPAAPCSETAWHLRRIEAGTALREAELTDAHNPWEAGLGHAIDLNKGCYIGQEVIARLDTYDKVKQQLVGLNLPSCAVEGMRLLDGDRDVGYVSSRVAGPTGENIGLGYVRKSQARLHHRLGLKGGGEASIRLVVPLSRA